MLSLFLFVLFLGFQFFRNYQSVFEHLLERKHLDSQLILFVQISDLIVTVVTRGNADARSGGPDLVGFHLAGSYSPVPESSRHGYSTTTATTTKIIVAVWFHLNKIFTEILDDFPGIFATAAVAADIAGVLVGAALVTKHALVQLESSLA